MGKKVLAVARNADLVLVIVDVFHPHHYSILIKELSRLVLRLIKTTSCSGCKN
jgi:ribosome-interacting GTPase 1